MHEQTETFWRENGNIYVRSRVGSRNYTMLTCLALAFMVPTTIPILSFLAALFDFGFVSESALTIATSIVCTVISLVPAVILARLTLKRFSGFKERIVRIESQHLRYGGFQKKWAKVSSIRVAPATVMNFRIAPFVGIIAILDLLISKSIGRLFPKYLAYPLQRETYGVWIKGVIIGGVFYDPGAAGALLDELAAEVDKRNYGVTPKAVPTHAGAFS